MTLDELIERRSIIITEMSAAGGVKSFTTEGGESVTLDWGKELTTIDAEISRLRPVPNNFGLGLRQLVPPGGGG